MNRHLIIMASGCAWGLQACCQSIMFSPEQLSTPDLDVYSTEFALIYAINGDGLLTDFASGQTLWDAYNNDEPCLALHSLWSNQSEFAGQILDPNVAHVVMDMGTTGPWEWIAIFNEEWQGFGNDPVVFYSSDSPDGPWTALCSAQLTNWPTNTNYAADLIHLEPPVAARFFRIRGSNSTYQGGTGAWRYALGEIIFGSVGNAPSLFPCTISCADVTSIAPATEALGLSVYYDAMAHAVRMIGAISGAEVRCFDLAGRILASGDTHGPIALPGDYIGLVLVHVRMPDGGTRTQRLVVRL